MYTEEEINKKICFFFIQYLLILHATRSSSVLSWVLDQTWVLDFCLRLFT